MNPIYQNTPRLDTANYILIDHTRDVSRIIEQLAIYLMGQELLTLVSMVFFKRNLALCE